MEEIENDVKKYFDAYSMHYLGNMKDFGDYSSVKSQMQKRRDEYSDLLQIIKTSVDKILSTIDRNVKEIKEVTDFRKEYPAYVRNQHPTDAIEFYNLIQKEDKDNKGFSYTKGAELIGVTRQTLSNWTKNGLYGFMRRYNKKVTKEELYKYFLYTLKRQDSSNLLPPHLKKKK